MNTIGEKIKNLLILRDMKQSDLAKITGISKATVSELVNNKKTNTSIENINKIAKALNVSPLYFLDEGGETNFEIISHLPKHIQQFILNIENIEYLLFAHQLKKRKLPLEALEKIIESYETLLNNQRSQNSI